MLLLNPGPVTLTERVRQSLLQTDLCHREPEFFDLQDEAKKRFVAAYALDPAVWNAVLMTGSGTAAVESMIAGLVPEGGRLLVVENGVYGDRIAQIAKQYGIDHEVVKYEWMQALDIDAIIHHETTTGRLNAIEQLSRACKERGVGLLLDAVSSFGAEAIDFDGGGIAATANKCLHGVPGTAFVIARRDALAKAASRTYYLGIARLAKLQDERNTPFTPSVHAYYALVEALREFEEEGGWRARHQRYARLAEQVRSGLANLGIESALSPAESSVVLRAYRLPKGVTYETLYDALKAKGFVIYAGQGGLSKELFRISTMGALDANDMDRLISSFVELLR
ncbi:2-aminoethylphosphonate:pyruvate aminotransferase [Candidatus Paraburkholderia schumanniana]|nr:2-aminoethylphosphonate:pyruvate aminotransferase [Candidatus Paraburkholderia schumannianae]